MGWGHWEEENGGGDEMVDRLVSLITSLTEGT